MWGFDTQRRNKQAYLPIQQSSSMQQTIRKSRQPRKLFPVPNIKTDTNLTPTPTPTQTQTPTTPNKFHNRSGYRSRNRHRRNYSRNNNCSPSNHDMQYRQYMNRSPYSRNGRNRHRPVEIQQVDQGGDSRQSWAGGVGCNGRTNKFEYKCVQQSSPQNYRTNNHNYPTTDTHNNIRQILPKTTDPEITHIPQSNNNKETQANQQPEPNPNKFKIPEVVNQNFRQNDLHYIDKLRWLIYQYMNCRDRDVRELDRRKLLWSNFMGIIGNDIQVIPTTITAPVPNQYTASTTKIITLTQPQSLTPTHTKIKYNNLHCLTVLGANILADGMFHQFYWFVWILSMGELNACQLFSITQDNHYEQYIHAITQNLPNFHSIRQHATPQQYVTYITNTINQHYSANTTKVDVCKGENQGKEGGCDSISIDSNGLGSKQEGMLHPLMECLTEMGRVESVGEGEKITEFQDGEGGYIRKQQQNINYVAPGANTMDIQSPQPLNSSFQIPQPPQPQPIPPSLCTNTPSPTLSKLLQQLTNEQQPISINKQLLKYRQKNGDRRAADSVCRFFGITDDRVFSMADVQVLGVLEAKREIKFQYVVVLARVREKARGGTKARFSATNVFDQQSQKELISSQYEQSSQNQNNFQQRHRILVSCYKYLKIQQFIRIQLTYGIGNIFGFIAYSRQEKQQFWSNIFEFFNAVKCSNKVQNQNKEDIKSDRQYSQQSNKYNRVKKSKNS